MRKGPAVADYVTIRDEVTGQERRVATSAAKFFVSQGFKVLDAKGHVSASATTAATKEK